MCGNGCDGLKLCHCLNSQRAWITNWRVRNSVTRRAKCTYTHIDCVCFATRRMTLLLRGIKSSIFIVRLTCDSVITMSLQQCAIVPYISIYTHGVWHISITFFFSFFSPIYLFFVKICEAYKMAHSIFTLYIIINWPKNSIESYCGEKKTTSLYRSCS